MQELIREGVFPEVRVFLKLVAYTTWFPQEYNVGQGVSNSDTGSGLKHSHGSSAMQKLDDNYKKQVPNEEILIP